jgi:hypothetical protein
MYAYMMISLDGLRHSYSKPSGRYQECESFEPQDTFASCVVRNRSHHFSIAIGQVGRLSGAFASIGIVVRRLLSIHQVLTAVSQGNLQTKLRKQSRKQVELL